MRHILLVTAILYVVWRILVAIGQRKRREARGADTFSRFSAASRRRERSGELLVPCDRCGVLVPASRLLEGPDGRYCSERCRDGGEAGGR